MLNRLFPLLLLISFILPGIWALTEPGFFLTDDGEWMVIRFSAFYENLVNGQFPVRFISRLNFGFGYPVSNFLYPLFMYIGAPIHFAGFGFVDTIKIILGGSFILGGVFSFLWLRKIFGSTASILGAFVYSFFPYHLWDIYKRGSVGEVLSLSIVPFILWQIERKNLTLVSLGLGLLILSHNTLALIFLPILAGYMVINTNIKFMLLTLFAGMGLSSFFWLPALYDLQFTVFSQTQVSDYGEFFINQSNFNLLGLISPVIILLSLFLFKKNKNFIYFLVITLLAFFLTLSLSSNIWEKIVSLVQFPFRFLSVVMLGLAFLAAHNIENLSQRLKNIVLVSIIILTFFSAKDFLVPTEVHNYPDSFYSTNQATTTVKNEYMPRWFKEASSSASSKVEVIKGGSLISNLRVSPNKVEFDLSGEGLVQVGIAYFPGWKVYINGEESSVGYEENGFIRFKAPQGESKIKVEFKETNLRLFSDLLSLISLLLIIGWFKFR